MIYIIFWIIVIAIVFSFFQYLWEHPIILVSLILLVIAFLAYSWVGVLVILVFGVIIYLLANLLERIKEHDAQAKAKQREITIRTNDAALQKELNENCKRLGYMDNKKWRKKLSNYCNRIYSTDFDTITGNFALQIEEQYITSNEDWFQPYLQYSIDHAVVTPSKLLSEVKCPQLYMTHVTPDFQLLSEKLEEKTQSKSRDVPALFKKLSLKEMNEPSYTPTQYAKNLYGKEKNNNDSNREEINFDDL